MATTYKKKDQIHGHFNQARHDKYDGLGRTHAKEFFEQLGYEVSDYDKTKSGDTQYNRPDQKAIKVDKTVYVEAAIKRSDLWKYVTGGVDVETRKLKYVNGETAYIAMSDETGENMLLIPMDCLVKAQKSCGSEYKGQKTPSSRNFMMPQHGCHRVRKLCSRGENQSGTIEDFYRIPYKHVKHFRKVENVYKKFGE